MNHMHHKLIIAALVAVLAVLVGCESIEEDWQAATAADTVGAYQQFLAEHPDSRFAEQARGRVEALRREAAFEAAAAEDTVEAYSEYLDRFPEAPNLDEVQARVTELRRARAWEALADSEDPAALRGFITRYPDSEPARRARERIDALEAAAARAAADEDASAGGDAAADDPAADDPAPQPAAEASARDESGAYAVQLAALESAAAAERAREAMAERYDEVLGEIELIVIEPPAGSRFHRVRTLAVTQQRGSELCEQLRAEGQDCLLVER